VNLRGRAEETWETVSKQKITELGRGEEWQGYHLQLTQVENLGMGDPTPQQNVYQ